MHSFFCFQCTQRKTIDQLDGENHGQKNSHARSLHFPLSQSTEIYYLPLITTTYRVPHHCVHWPCSWLRFYFYQLTKRVASIYSTLPLLTLCLSFQFVRNRIIPALLPHYSRQFISTPRWHKTFSTQKTIPPDNWKLINFAMCIAHIYSIR